MASTNITKYFFIFNLPWLAFASSSATFSSNSSILFSVVFIFPDKVWFDTQLLYQINHQ